ncbi:MAG: ribosome silencing factor [bacterium]
MHEKLEIIKESILEKKGFDIKIIDISELTTIADFFVICSGATFVQTNAIYRNIRRNMKKHYKIHGEEGEDSGDWILMDYSDVIVHIFVPETRERFNLELLWADGKFLEVEELNDS